jgi:hypothetical protein
MTGFFETRDKSAKHDMHGWRNAGEDDQDGGGLPRLPERTLLRDRNQATRPQADRATGDHHSANPRGRWDGICSRQSGESACPLP